MFKIYNSKEDWLEARNEGIGGSEASCVLGLNPWRTREQLLKEKISLKVHKIPETEAMEFGKRLEEPLIDLYGALCRDQAVDIVKQTPDNNKVFISEEYPFMRYTPDAVFTTPEGYPGMLEAKTTTIGPKNLLAKWAGGIPDHYMAQIFHGLAVNPQWVKASFIAFLNRWDETGKFGEVRVGYFNRGDVEESIAILVEEEKKFWEEVENGRNKKG
jgi:putative phage-type endonuclease